VPFDCLRRGTIKNGIGLNPEKPMPLVLLV